MSGLTFEDQRSVRSDEHSTSTCSTNWTSAAFSVDCNVSCENDSVTTIPRRALNPVDRIEERRCGTVAGIFRVDTLNIRVARGCKEVHKDCFDRLGLVNDSLGTDIEATD